MYCNICASDYEFINFLNTFIAENGLSVYDPINKLWLRRIDEKVNAKAHLYITLLFTRWRIQQKFLYVLKDFYQFINTVKLIQKYIAA